MVHVAVLAGAFFGSIAPRLQPRFYSISSAPAAHPGAVHITCAIVHDTTPSGRTHEGIASFFLKRAAVGGSCSSSASSCQGSDGFCLPNVLLDTTAWSNGTLRVLSRPCRTHECTRAGAALRLTVRRCAKCISRSCRPRHDALCRRVRARVRAALQLQAAAGCGHASSDGRPGHGPGAISRLSAGASVAPRSSFVFSAVELRAVVALTRLFASPAPYRSRCAELQCVIEGNCFRSSA